MKKNDLIDFLILAAEQKASDLHLTAGAPPMMRVAGVIKPVSEEALSPEDTRRLVVETLKEEQRRSWKMNDSLTSRWRLVISGGIAEMRAMCQVRLRRIFDGSLMRSAI